MKIEFSIENGLVAHLFAHVFLHIALLTPPARLSHTKLAILFLPMIYGCNFFAWKCQLGFIAALHTLWVTELLLFRYPREDFKVLKINEQFSRAAKREDDKIELVSTEVYPTSLWKRFLWVNKLVVSPRYIGWDIGSSTQSKIFPTSESLVWKVSFLTRQSLLLVIYFVLWDTTNYYQYFDPYFQIYTPIDESLPRRLLALLSKHHLAFLSLSPRAVRLMIYAIQQCAVLALVFTFFSLIFVFLGVIGVVDVWWGATGNWRGVMGNPYVLIDGGLRGFWGAFWWQFYRAMFSSPARVFGNMFGFWQKNLLGYIYQLLGTFLIAGAFHALTAPLTVEHPRPMAYALFFWTNGGLVALEAMIEHNISKNTSSLVRPFWKRTLVKCSRLGWVVGALYCTAPLYVDEHAKLMRQAGLKGIFLFSLPEDKK